MGAIILVTSALRFWEAFFTMRNKFGHYTPVRFRTYIDTRKPPLTDTTLLTPRRRSLLLAKFCPLEAMGMERPRASLPLIPLLGGEDVVPQNAHRLSEEFPHIRSPFALLPRNSKRHLLIFPLIASSGGMSVF
jgi:hypothetical protein